MVVRGFPTSRDAVTKSYDASDGAQIIVVYGQLVAGLNSSQGQLVTWLGFSASLVYLVYLVRLHKDFIFSSLLK